jgi:aminobenzoyl-glutamate transport protein
LVLIAIVLALSHILHLSGTSVTTQVIEPDGPSDGAIAESDLDYKYPYSEELFDSHKVEEETIAVKSLLTTEGIRFMYSSLIPSFMSFTAVGLIIVAILGVGVAEEAGLVNALIRKLVVVSPRNALCYILVFVGILSSIAADAGYLVLIPLAGTAFLSVGRHPLAGLATGFAAVAGAFTVNMLIKPLDAILTEFTNDAIHLVDPQASIGLTANLWFSIASVLFLTILVTLITEWMVEPRLGAFQGEKPAEEGGNLSEAESRGLRFALFGLIGVLILFGLLTIPSGAPLRNPETGALIGDSPFMNGLIAVIMMLFLVTGAAYGLGAGTLKGITAIIKAMEKALAGLGSLLLLLFVISQFVAYFNYSNLGTIMAVRLAGMLQEANLDPLWLLIGFIVVVAFIDLFITGAQSRNGRSLRRFLCRCW